MNTATLDLKEYEKLKSDSKKLNKLIESLSKNNKITLVKDSRFSFSNFELSIGVDYIKIESMSESENKKYLEDIINKKEKNIKKSVKDFHINMKRQRELFDIQENYNRIPNFIKKIFNAL